MDETATYTQFVDQTVSQLNPKELLDLVKKNLKIFGEIEQKQFKRLESQLKYEKKIEEKEKDKRNIDDKRQKVLDDLKEKNYKDELNRVNLYLRGQKEIDEILKASSVSDVLSLGRQDTNISRFQKNEEDVNKSVFEKISSTLELIPEKIKKTIRKPQDEMGEQRNLGENILKVSFHKEGIQILKTLLDPIYKALEANTENLDKMLKKITDGEGGGGMGWLALLAGAVFVFIETVYKRIKGVLEIFQKAKTSFFSWLDELFKLPEKIRDAFRNSKIVEFLKEKWTNIFDSVKDFGTYIKAYWDEFIVTPLKEKWTSFMVRAKETIKFDELADTFKLKWMSWSEKTKNFFNFDGFTKRIESAGKSASTFWDSVKSGWISFGETIGGWWEKGKGALDSVKSWFSEEGFIGKIISKMKIAFEGLTTSFENVLKFLDPVFNTLRQAGSFIKPLLNFLGYFLVILDPLIAAGKTLFNVWNNENLNFFEKSIAVLTSAFFGLGDGIATLIGLISEGVTGIWNLITGKGWTTDNPVGNFIRGMTNDYSFGGMGEQMGGQATLAMSDTAEDAVLNKDFDPTNTPKYKKLQELKKDGLTPEEEDYLDTKFNDQGQLVDDFVMQPKGISSLILDRKNDQLYQTSPDDEIIASKKGGILDRSLQDIKMIMSDVNKNILNLNSNMLNIKPSVINNNSTSMMGSKDNTNYIAKAMYDVNTDKRANWWRISREYASTI